MSIEPGIYKMDVLTGDTMLYSKLWLCNTVPGEKAEKLSAEAGIPGLLAKIFLNRGMEDADSIRKFLEPSLDDLNDPFLLKDMDRAVDRIIHAVDVKEKIIIYGDYDVDGITSTAVLCHFLSSLGANVDYYIPDRLDEGYGLSVNAIDRIKAVGAELIVTVDCGITAAEEIRHINDCGMCVVVTDHHECKGTLPDALALVNPCRPDCTYPFKELAGVGVVFKLINAICIRKKLGSRHLDYLDLVAVGTIADVVPLVDENRIIAKFGMEMVENTANIGLSTLIENSGLKDKPVNSWSISFAIAPRINAAGRVGSALRAVRLFLTTNAEEALDIAQQLNDANKFRQDTESEIFRQVIDIIESRAEFKNEKVLVVSGEGWHHGVIGIVASKITERYYKPCILISCEDGIGKGSGRSIEGFNLFKALDHCEKLLLRFGGHELAAGLSLEAGVIDEFRKAINLYADSVLSESDLVPRVKIDIGLESSEITLDNARMLELLAPFGAGNPCPVFAYRNIRIQDIRTVGENKHIKIKLGEGSFLVDAIGFNMGGLADVLNNTDYFDVACQLEVNSWNSVDRVQLNLRDIKPCDRILARNRYLYRLDKYIEFDKLNDYNRDDRLLKKLGTSSNIQADPADEINIDRIPADAKLCDLVPERQDFVAVYQYLKSNCKDSLVIDDLFVFARRVAASYKIDMNYFKLKKCIEVFAELKLLTKEQLGEYGMIVEINGNVKEKTNLENSALYRQLRMLKAKYEMA